MIEIQKMTKDHIFYIAGAVLAMRNTDETDISFSEMEWYSPQEKEIILYQLNWIPRIFQNLPGINVWLEDTEKDYPVLKIKKNSIGDCRIQNGEIQLKLHNDAWLISRNMIGRLQDFSNATNLLCFSYSNTKENLSEDYGYPSLQIAFRNNTAKITKDMLSFQDGIYIHVFPMKSIYHRIHDRQKKIMAEHSKLFPFSRQGIEDALTYSSQIYPALSNNQPEIMHIHIAVRFIGHDCNKLFEAIHLYDIYHENITCFFPSVSSEILETWKKKHPGELDYPVEGTKPSVDSSSPVIQTEYMIQKIQKMIDRHIDDLKKYALSHHYETDPEKQYRTYFLYPNLLFMDQTKYRSATNELPLDWHDIPASAVGNAFLLLRKIVACSTMPVELLCIPSIRKD